MQEQFAGFARNQEIFLRQEEARWKSEGDASNTRWQGIASSVTAVAQEMLERNTRLSTLETKISMDHQTFAKQEEERKQFGELWRMHIEKQMASQLEKEVAKQLERKILEVESKMQAVIATDRQNTQAVIATDRQNTQAAVQRLGTEIKDLRKANEQSWESERAKVARLTDRMAEMERAIRETSNRPPPPGQGNANFIQRYIDGRTVENLTKSHTETSAALKSVQNSCAEAFTAMGKNSDGLTWKVQELERACKENFQKATCRKC